MARLATLLTLVLTLLLTLAGCGRAPEATQVQKDLADRLAQVFDPGTFEIVSLSDRGSSPDASAPAGEDRWVVYYDTRLKLTRDVDFGSWNTPGAASLVTVLGAGTKGVTGAKAGGNKAGDEIVAHGTAIYAMKDGAWHEVAPAGFTPPVVPALETISPPSVSERLLASLRDAVHAVPTGTQPAAQAVVTQELTMALATIQARLARLQKGYPIAAGPERGQYVRFVQALKAANPAGPPIQALLTAGSVENIELLRRGQVPLAMVQANLARQAMAGEGPFAADGPFPGLRAIGSLWPEMLHIIVRADSPFHTLRDLTHKRIAMGPAGSGTEATATRVLAAAGMESGRDYTADGTSPLAAALVALEKGEVDAVLEMIGAPADQIRTAAADLPLRLLPVDEPVLAALTAEDPALLRGAIAKGSYPGVDTAISTIEVPALLVTTTALTDSEVAALVKILYGGKVDLLDVGSAQGGQLGIRTAHVGLPIPLADGAEAALTSLGAGG